MKSTPMYELVIVGSGPSGLSCAIEAKKAGLSAVVLEKGSLVDSIRRFPTNLVWFSTPELLEIGDVPFVISTVRPTRVDTLNYYRKVSEHHNLDIRLFDEVSGIIRENGQFRVETRQGRAFAGKNVVLATGYFDHPNRLDIPGETQAHVLHYYREAFEYSGCRVAVVGGRNSAVEAALDLYRHGARVTLIHRGERLSSGVKYWILPDIENRIKAGEVRTMFGSRVIEIQRESIVVGTGEEVLALPIDFTFVLIGFHPDTSMLRRAGVELDEGSLAPLFNKESFETNVPGLYVAGSLTAGKDTNKVFVENGRGHGRVIVASILARRN